jgi:hypothetical protein
MAGGARLLGRRMGIRPRAGALGDRIVRRCRVSVLDVYLRMVRRAAAGSACSHPERPRQRRAAEAWCHARGRAPFSVPRQTGQARPGHVVDFVRGLGVEPDGAPPRTPAHTAPRHTVRAVGTPGSLAPFDELRAPRACRGAGALRPARLRPTPRCTNRIVGAPARRRATRAEERSSCDGRCRR